MTIVFLLLSFRCKESFSILSRKERKVSIVLIIILIVLKTIDND